MRVTPPERMPAAVAEDQLDFAPVPPARLPTLRDLILPLSQVYDSHAAQLDVVVGLVPLLELVLRPQWLLLCWGSSR